MCHICFLIVLTTVIFMAAPRIRRGHCIFVPHMMCNARHSCATWCTTCSTCCSCSNLKNLYYCYYYYYCYKW